MCLNSEKFKGFYFADFVFHVFQNATPTKHEGPLDSKSLGLNDLISSYSKI